MLQPAHLRRHGATLRFKLRKRERIDVWMERDGERAVTLVPGRTYPKGPVRLAFAGVDDDRARRCRTAPTCR